VLRFADRLAYSAGVLQRPIDADRLIDRACAGGSWQPPPAQVEALRRLLAAAESEASLSLFGRAALRWDIARFLGNARRMAEEEAARPALRQVAIERPVFILGLPRSGTSFLHALLAEDPGTLAPRCWQTVYPYPAPPPRRDRRIAQVDRQLALFARLAPELPSVHPMDAHTPQECSEITAHTFRSLRFDTTFRVPSYLRWLDAAGHDDAYGFHARFLRHLQAQGGEAQAGQAAAARRWVLKCPDHVFAIEAIRRVYPDACFVFVHRDPLHVLASVARLTEILRAPFTRRLDRGEIGQQVSDRWVLGAAQIEAAADALARDGAAVCHVTYADLVTNPWATVRRVYWQVGLPLSDLAAARIGARIQARPDGGYGRNHYDLGEYGLQACHEARRFEGYVRRFLTDAAGPTGLERSRAA
jgi:hypothetical protein